MPSSRSAARTWCSAGAEVLNACFFAPGLELPKERRRAICGERQETRRLARSFSTLRVLLALASTPARPGSCESCELTLHGSTVGIERPRLTQRCRLD